MYRIFKRGVNVFRFMTIKVIEYIKQRGTVVVNDKEL
jgi:glutathione synthase/RimK-type ligase-like ATP-grasp enzyme